MVATPPRKQATYLSATLELRQTEMEIEEPDALLRAAGAEGRPRVQGAAPFLEGHGEIDILLVIQWKATQKSVSVVPSPQLHIREVGPVWQSERVPDDVDLPLHARARHALVDLLQQHEVRHVLREDLDDAIRPVLPVHAADALVDIIGYDAETGAASSYCCRGHDGG